MAKIIKLTPDRFDDIKRDFEEALYKTKLSDGRISFVRSFSDIKREATVYFTAEAWQKMQALISSFDKEVAWHGLAYRGEEGKDDYFIGDILVYPQEVTGTTVNTDQKKYETWLMEQENEVFNNIRMQGHSHVNMGVTPSSVDTSLYERILDQLDDDMFYIFLIYNKRGDKTFKIYDMAKNVLFETADVTVKILEDMSPRVNITADGEISDEEREVLTDYLVSYRNKKRMDKFVADAKTMVKDRVYTPSYPAYQYNGGMYHGVTPATSQPVQQAISVVNMEHDKSVSDKQETKVTDFPKKRKGRRKGKRSKHNGAFAASPAYSSAYDDEDYNAIYGIYD